MNVERTARSSKDILHVQPLGGPRALSKAALPPAALFAADAPPFFCVGLGREPGGGILSKETEEVKAEKKRGKVSEG